MRGWVLKRPLLKRFRICLERSSLKTIDLTIIQPKGILQRSAEGSAKFAKLPSIEQARLMHLRQLGTETTALHSKLAGTSTFHDCMQNVRKLMQLKPRPALELKSKRLLTIKFAECEFRNGRVRSFIRGPRRFEARTRVAGRRRQRPRAFGLHQGDSVGDYSINTPVASSHRRITAGRRR